MFTLCFTYRYSSQDQFVSTAQEFHNRSIPVDIIVIDYHHWVHMGDWSFDPKSWPSPQEMVDTISKLGMRIMVSVWPFSAVGSSSFPTINSSNYGVDNGDSGQGIDWPDPNCGGKCFLYDPTQQKAREYVWSRIKEVSMNFFFWTAPHSLNKSLIHKTSAITLPGSLKNAISNQLRSDPTYYSTEEYAYICQKLQIVIRPLFFVTHTKSCKKQTNKVNMETTLIKFQMWRITASERTNQSI